MENDCGARYECCGREREHCTLAEFAPAHEPAKNKRDQRAEQGNGPAGDGAHRPMLQERFRNQSLQYDAGQ